MLFIFIEFPQILRRLSNNSLKILSSPLDSMLNLIWEILQSTKRNSLFWRINNIIIALSIMWDNNL